MNRYYNRIHNISRKISIYPDLERSKSILNYKMHMVNELTNRKLGIHKLGIHRPHIYHNLSYKELLNHEIKNNEGKLLNTKYGYTYSVDTGIFTGRSPKDKWIVKNIESENNIHWGNNNQAINGEVFSDLYDQAIKHFNKLDNMYVYDGYCGSNSNSRKNIRFIHEMSWQQHFVKNMFIRPKKDDLHNFTPDFTIINACSIKNKNWEQHGLNSDVAIAFNIERKIGIILGTWYGGENKKGIFSLMNYWLPLKNIMSMHCSANVGKNGDSALFFGLSGTGKTTLSVNPNRYLIGDDEHGWDEEGIFNLEGGCYAKTINLSEKNEPDIYKSIRTNALLENVSYNNEDKPEYYNTQKTENGRVSYPIFHVNNWHKLQKATHPKNIIFLTCDAYGVLPPISKLSHGQAMYHFLSGYTAKVAGTERGINEPTITFSACFGEAFLPLHPTKYADLLKEKIEKHGSNVFLVNTGWTGGKYGEGTRININDTRKCIDAILSGRLLNSKFREDPVFKFQVPLEIEGINNDLCNPRNTWSNKKEYDKQYQILANLFKENYQKYVDENFTDYSKYGPV